MRWIPRRPFKFIFILQDFLPALQTLHYFDLRNTLTTPTMVNFTAVQEWNSKLKDGKTFPQDPVIVITGGTNGIGAATAKAFAKLTVRPRLYIVGRSQETADAVLAECRSLNSEGTFSFIKADLSLIKNVDEISEQIQKLEPKINILVLSAGEADLSRSCKFHQTVEQICCVSQN
jgi:hypothetical protein